MSASVSTTENQLGSSTPGRDIEATAEASKAHSLAPSSVKSETFPSNNRAVDGEPREEGGVEGNLEDSEQRNSDPPESHLEEKDAEVRHGPFFVEPLRSSGQSQTRFGIRGSRRHASGVDPIKIASGGGDGGYIGAFDYDKKYPADKYREEMGPEARVWKIYLDEAAEDDRFRIENLRDTLDVILVFAGLFSAVVTTFVVHTVENLEGYSSWETTQTSLLTEMICIQRSIAAGTPLDACDSSSVSVQPDPASSHDYEVNSLFFASLTLALCTALAAVLAKQWLHHYLQPVPGSPQDRARKHQFRYDGFVRYRIEAIVGLLPILIHASLFLFFIGLCIFLSPLHRISTIFVAVTTGLTLVLYLISNILPIFDIQCPYHTPLTTAIFETSSFIYSPLVNFLKFCVVALLDHARGNIQRILGRIYQALEHERKSLQQLEGQTIQDRGTYWDIRCIGWLRATTTDAKVHGAACQAFAGLPHKLTDDAKEELRNPIHDSAFGKEFRILSESATKNDSSMERFARAVTLFAPHDSLQLSDNSLRGIATRTFGIEDFASRVLQPQSIILNASLYSMLSSVECGSWVFRKENVDMFADFFVSLVIDIPNSIDSVVLSHVIILASKSVDAIKKRLTLGSLGESGVEILDQNESIGFLIKAVGLFHKIDSGNLQTRSPPIHVDGYLSRLICEIIPIPVRMYATDDDETVFEQVFEDSRQTVYWSIASIHVLAYLTQPERVHKLQMFSSEIDVWKLPDRPSGRSVLAEEAHRTLCAALSGAIRSILSSNDGAPPAYWKVLYKVAKVAEDILDLEDKDCDQAILAFEKRLEDQTEFDVVATSPGETGS